MSPFAVFVFAYAGGSLRLAATTRAADRGEEGRIGLPGGKIDNGETPDHAVRREAYEEGWNLLDSPLVLVHQADVEGRLVWWYGAVRSAFRVFGHAEEGRIIPVRATLEEIACSGYGNRAAVAALRRSAEWHRARRHEFDARLEAA